AAQQHAKEMADADRRELDQEFHKDIRELKQAYFAAHPEQCEQLLAAKKQELLAQDKSDYRGPDDPSLQMWARIFVETDLQKSVTWALRILEEWASPRLAPIAQCTLCNQHGYRVVVLNGRPSARRCSHNASTEDQFSTLHES